MEQIIIDGINLTELKAEYDALAAKQAEMRKSIVKGSSKFIADSVKEALELFEELKGVETKEDAHLYAQQIYDKLKTVEFVSTVSGVTYYLPYYNRQGEYYPAGTPISTILEDGDNELLTDWDYTQKDNPLIKLYGLAESMESEVCEWNTSYC